MKKSLVSKKRPIFVRFPMTVSATVFLGDSKEDIKKALMLNAEAQIHEYIFGDPREDKKE